MVAKISASKTASIMALKNWVPQVRKALNAAMADHIVLTQSKLAQACPKDTGRLASSFFIGKDNPDLSVRPEDWSTPAKRKYSGVGSEGEIITPGVTKVELKKYPNQITFDGDWYISNNLPYAQRVAFDFVYSKGAPGGENWFTHISSQQRKDLQKRIISQLKKIK